MEKKSVKSDKMHTEEKKDGFFFLKKEIFDLLKTRSLSEESDQTPSETPSEAPPETPSEIQPSSRASFASLYFKYKFVARYKSFDDFYRDNYYEILYGKLPNPPDFKNVSKTCLDRIKLICDIFGIILECFKTEKNHYYMTANVVSLFQFIKNTIDFKYRSQIRKKSADIKIEDLTALREGYHNALESCKCNSCIIERALRYFDEKTGCPPYDNYVQLSEHMANILKDFEMSYRVKLSDHEKYYLGRELEYIYNYTFYPRFYDCCMEKIIEYLDKNNIPYGKSKEEEFMEELNPAISRTHQDKT